MCEKTARARLAPAESPPTMICRSTVSVRGNRIAAKVSHVLGLLALAEKVFDQSHGLFELMGILLARGQAVREQNGSRVRSFLLHIP